MMPSIFHHTHGGPTSLIEPGVLCSHFSGEFSPAHFQGSNGHASSLGMGRLTEQGAGYYTSGIEMSVYPLRVSPLKAVHGNTSSLSLLLVRLLHVPPDGRRVSQGKDTFFWASAIHHKGPAGHHQQPMCARFTALTDFLRL